MNNRPRGGGHPYPKTIGNCSDTDNSPPCQFPEDNRPARSELAAALIAVRRAPTVEAKLKAVSAGAFALYDDHDALDLLSDDAIYVHELDPDQVQRALAAGWHAAARRVTPASVQPGHHKLPTSTIQALEHVLLYRPKQEFIDFLEGRSDRERLAIAAHIRKMKRDRERAS
jgi:hypothetical protein